MASTTVFSFKPTLSIRTHATSSSGSRSGASSNGSGSRSAGWWTPIFGWSSQADYIESSATSAASPPATPAPRRFGVFTEEKARELRKKMMENETYHDTMYHSAIASRLASDISREKGYKA